MGRRRKPMSIHMQCLITAIGFLLLAWLFFPASTDEEDNINNGEIIVDETPPLSRALSVDIIF